MPVTISALPGGDRVGITFPYDPAAVEAVKTIPGRRWDPSAKRWTAPLSSARAILAFAVRTSAEGDALDQIRALAGEQDAAATLSRATDADVTVPVPDGLALLPFQRAGVAYGLTHPMLMVCDEMGLGKTVQAIALVNADPSIRRVAVIAPASLKINWSREITRWSTRPTSVVVGNGQSVAPWDGLFTRSTSVEWLVVNYDVLNKWGPTLRAADLDALVMDEAHYLKNPKAQRTIAVLGRWDRDPAKRLDPIPARRRIALTGTPILNRPVEMWPLLHSLAPQTFRSFRAFAFRHCAAVETRWGLDTSGASNLAELQDILRATLMVRRLKADVLAELPAKRRAVVELPASAAAAAAVRTEQETVAQSEERLKGLRAAVEAAEASGDPEAYRRAVEALRSGEGVEFATVSRVRHEVALAKVDAVIAHLTDALDGSDGKVVVFAHHLDVVARIAAAFPGAVVVTGETSLPDRQRAVDAFQADPNVRLFVGNIKAAGVGLTLTASSHVVFAELDWTPANLSQAEDRTHRIGQRNSVLVQHLVLEGSLDATMARKLIAKQEVIDAGLDTVTQAVAPEPITIREPDERQPRKPQPEPVVEQGMYRNPETGDIFKVQIAVHGSGRLYAKRLVVRPEGGGGDFVYEPGLVSRLDAAWRMTVEEASAWGRLYGWCCVCGRTLTDERSIAFGIGPVCRGNL